MKCFFVLVLLVLVFCNSVFAKSLELKKNSGTILIQEKSSWELGKDLFGIPFIYFAPKQNGQRSNISFTDTGAELELDVKTLSANQKDYQAGRKKWAEQVGASIIDFAPYQSFQNKNGHKVHNIGVNYTHEKKVYSEKSYYIECRGKLLFSKSLRLEVNSAHDKDFGDLIQSLDCGAV
jgi:hypothetical protein